MKQVLLLLCMIPLWLSAQDAYFFQSDFTKEEFATRRNKVYDAIGKDAFALVQGAPDVRGFNVFRQSNTMYYLTGFEAPHAYLLLHGRRRQAILYVQHRNPSRERNEGKTLSFEDAELIKQLTGIEEVKALEDMPRDWVYGGLVRPPHPIIYTPFSPAETGTDSRDELLRYQSSVTNDPWDGRPSGEGQFINLLKERYPQFEIRDLSPILDNMRNIKSEAEIALIRRASQLSGLGLMEAIRCTEPGVYEYQLEASARYIHQINGAKRDAYTAIVGGGQNAWMGHYFLNNDALKSGDMVLMDFSPEYRYYTSDITRMWPVSGKFTSEQLELYNFIVAYRAALMKQIKPGVTVNQVLDFAAAEMKQYIDTHKFSKPHYKKAVEAALVFRGHMQHPVGMAVHDVGDYKATPLTPGEVFAVDPMIWVPEEKLYVRVEDVVVVTETGMENFSAFVPVDPKAIEELMKEPGILSLRPPTAESQIKKQ
ncbi:MAG: Xaa-Pro peptidase family protein [Saprospiraceae bacterium]|nr:Xaa-Pro peptidase family protein [Saprospiraceae bacterium]